MSPCLRLGDISRFSVTERGCKRSIAASRNCSFASCWAAKHLSLRFFPRASVGVKLGCLCPHSCMCVCFTKYSFVSLVTPEDHTNVFSTSCLSSPFSQWKWNLSNPIQEILTCSCKYFILPSLCPFYMRRQTFHEHASVPIRLPASICDCIKPDTLQRGCMEERSIILASACRFCMQLSGWKGAISQP